MTRSARTIVPFMVIRDKCGICGSIVKSEDSFPVAQRLQRAHRPPNYPFTADPGEPESPNLNFLADLATATPVYPKEPHQGEVFMTAIKHDFPSILHDYLDPVIGLNGSPVVYYPTCNVYNAVLDDTMLDNDAEQEELRDSIMSQAPGVLIHQACLNLAKKAMAYRTRHLPRSAINIESELDLSRCLTIRFSTNLFTKIDWSGLYTNGPILYTHWENPNMYHGAADYGERTVIGRDEPGFFGRTMDPKYPPRYPFTNLPPVYLSDPYESVYATPVFITLLSNPRLFKTPHFNANNPLTKNLQSLPPETLNQILSDVFHPFTNASLKCNYILPPRWWYDALRTNDLIPWLYDVDFRQVEKHLGKGDPGSARDWEMVARILSQDDVMERFLPSASLAIKNRHRVWRLCMEMEIAESAESDEQKEAMVRYENRGGRLLPPLPAVSDEEEKELAEA